MRATSWSCMMEEPNIWLENALEAFWQCSSQKHVLERQTSELFPTLKQEVPKSIGPQCTKRWVSSQAEPLTKWTKYNGERHIANSSAERNQNASSLPLPFPRRSSSSRIINDRHCHSSNAPSTLHPPRHLGHLPSPSRLVDCHCSFV